jgi:DNA-directed RNA polymerase subunit beta
MGEDDDDLLRAAEELGIDLSGVRVPVAVADEGDQEDPQAADQELSEAAPEGDGE